MNLDQIKIRQAEAFQQKLDHLQRYCDNYPNIKKFVDYIIANFNEDKYRNRSMDAKIGGDLVQAIYCISGMTIGNVNCLINFDLDWISTLNSFIGNYFLDDCAYKVDFTGRTFEFSASSNDDWGDNWLQDPTILIAAVKANRKYYDLVDDIGPIECHMQNIGVDTSEVDALYKEGNKVRV